MKMDNLSLAAGYALLPSWIISNEFNYSLGAGILVWVGVTFVIYLVMETSKNIQSDESTMRHEDEAGNSLSQNSCDLPSSNLQTKFDQSQQNEQSSKSKAERKIIDIDMPTILALPELTEAINFFRPGDETTWLRVSSFKYGDVGTFKAEYIAPEAASMYIRIHLENHCSIKEVEWMLEQKRHEIENIIKTALPDYEHADKAALELYLRATKNGDVHKPYYCI